MLSEILPSDAQNVIEISNLSKKYGLPLPKRFPWPFHRFSKHQTMAIESLSLTLGRGEVLGIIGRNGAGKSTLLKILAGVTPPTTGNIVIQGRVFPMIELNAGLHLELTGRENARLLGAIMGMTRSQISEEMDNIERFCDIDNWFDQPVRKYSSGMLARLGFGVAVHAHADILLVDEVLSVGDLPFQRKCYRKMEQLRKQGASIVFVSHSIRQVERLCSRVILLEKGIIVSEGDPKTICYQYMKQSANGNDRANNILFHHVSNHEGSGELLIQNVLLINKYGFQCTVFETYDPATIVVQFVANELVDDPIVGIGIYTADMLLLSAFSDELAFVGITFKGAGQIHCKIPHLPMLPGVYSVGVTIKGRDNHLIYKGQSNAMFQVQFSRRVKQSRGLVHIEPNWKLSEEHIIFNLK